jgi:hypothetical protein
MDEMANAPLDVFDFVAGIALVPMAVEGLCGDAELNGEIGRQILGRDLTALFAPEAADGAFVCTIMMRASDPPMKSRRSSGFAAE